MLLERHIKRIVGKPRSVIAAERVKLRSALFKAAPRSLAQKRHTVRAQLFVIDRLRITAPIGSSHLGSIEQPVLHKHIKINKIRIAGKA